MMNKECLQVSSCKAKMLEDANEVIRSNDHQKMPMAKTKWTKGQALINQTLHIKLKTERHEPLKNRVYAGAPEG